MKSAWASHLVLGIVVLALVQGPRPSESGGLKKAVKATAKTFKKLGLLMALQKKKLYAIPFPMPLPVFVKRQHIYTQVPIIPRYVQGPQPYGQPAYSDESASYEMLGSPSTSGYTAEPPPSLSPVYPPPKGTYGGSSANQHHRGKSKKHYQDESQGYAAGLTSGTGAASASMSSRYLSQIASLLGQSYPILGGGGGNKDLLSKLLSGQAKLLTPTALLSAIKRPAAGGPSLVGQQQQADAAPEQDQDHESKSNPAAGSPPSSSSASNSDDDSHSSATKAPSESPHSSSAPDSTKPAASELHRGRYKPSPYAIAMRTPHGMLADPRRFPAAALMAASPAAAMMSPFAALMAAQAPVAMMPRLPMLQQAAISGLLAQMDPLQQAAAAHTIAPEQMEPQPSEQSEMLAHDLQQAAGAPAYHSQLLEQRREMLRLALLREREEAARLAESRAAFVRAAQLSQQLDQQRPVSRQQAARLMQFVRQQQMTQRLERLQRLRQLQDIQQHQQQQLAQNTIDKRRRR